MRQRRLAETSDTCIGHTIGSQAPIPINMRQTRVPCDMRGTAGRREALGEVVKFKPKPKNEYLTAGSPAVLNSIRRNSGLQILLFATATCRPNTRTCQSGK